jgi:putative oxidoreductase
MAMSAPDPLADIRGFRLRESRALPGGIMDRRTTAHRGIFLLRLLLGALFIAHLYWKFAVLPGGLTVWWGNLLKAGYPSIAPAYVLSAEFAGALLLIPGVLTRYVAVYAMPMMLGAAQFWFARKGFYFTGAGAELPLVWLALLGIQAFMGDGALALVRSPGWRTLASGIGVSLRTAEVS